MQIPDFPPNKNPSRKGPKLYSIRSISDSDGGAGDGQDRLRLRGN